MKKNINLKRKIQWTFVSIWMICLCLFVGLRFSASVFDYPQFKPFPAYENRHPNPLPDFSSLPIKKYGSGIEDWYNDNFAYRTDVIDLYRNFHYFVLKAYFGREVPGVGDWVFRHGGDWAELDDYLGAIVLKEKEIKDLVTLFEGRVEWARAHGSEFVQVITPVKAQMHPEKLPFMVRCHKGRGVTEQMKAALENSLARDNVLFFDEVIANAVKENQEVFYYEDHHLNAYGSYLLYRELNKYLATKFENIGLMQYYDNPPQEVIDGTAMGCYRSNRRLVISRPGDSELCDKYITETRGGRPFPLTCVGTTNVNDGISIAMAHDSIMRYALSSWKEDTAENMHFPFGDGVEIVRSYIFNRFPTGLMSFIMTEDVPDVFVEQFAECKFNQGCIGMDAIIRKAAKFLNGREISKNDIVEPGNKIIVRVVFDNIVLEGYTPVGKEMKKLSVKLLYDGKEVAKDVTFPGVKRAIYFEVPLSEQCAMDKFSIKVGPKTSYEKSQISFKVVEKE